MPITNSVDSIVKPMLIFEEDISRLFFVIIFFDIIFQNNATKSQNNKTTLSFSLYSVLPALQ